MTHTLTPSAPSSRNAYVFWIWSCVLAVLFSVIVMLPSLLQRYDERYPYQGMHILGPDAEVYYAARVHEIYDGFPMLGNVFFSEPKDQPALQPPLPEWTIAYSGMLLGLDALDAFLLSKIVLSLTVFLSLTWFLVLVTDRRWISLLATIAALQAGALLAAPWDLPLFLHPSTAAFEFLRFSRAVNPQWTMTFFFLELCCITLWVRGGRKLPLLIAAIGSSTLIYSYLYAWTYFFAAIGVLTLWYLVARDWRRVKDLAQFWLIVAAVFVPYFFHLSAVTHHPWYAETGMRFGLVTRHGPAVFGVWCAVFIGLALASRSTWSRSWPLLPAVAIAGFIAFNQQLLTGQHIVHHHYNWYFIQPMASVFACALALSLLPMERFSGVIRKTGGLVIILISLFIALTQQWVGYRGVRDVWGPLQLAAPMFAYAAENLHPGQVVYSQDMTILNHIPAYTSADVYTSNNAYLSLSPDERTRFIYFMEVWMQGLTPEDAAKEFSTSRRFMVSTRIHGIYYREAVGDYRQIPDADVRKNVEWYREFYALPVKEKLTRYPISVVITTPTDPTSLTWSEFLRCSTEVFAKNGYTLRLMIPAGEPSSCL